MDRLPQLLVSVRSAAEAEAALAGGAHLIDVKEPRHGPLGRASDATVAAVLAAVAGRRPVSAALGELADRDDLRTTGLAYAKWGLSRLGDVAPWPALLDEARRRVARTAPSCRVVTVAYADWQAAQAPSVEAVLAFACCRPGSVLLLDTYQKAPPPGEAVVPTLLDVLALREVVALCERCRAAGVRVALAGSLKQPQIEALRPARPDWFAVRGAACDADQRDAAVSARKVCELVKLLQ